MDVGTEWLVDAYDCYAAALSDPARVREACERILAGLRLRVVGAPIWHQFPPPGGVTRGLPRSFTKHQAAVIPAAQSARNSGA